MAADHVMTMTMRAVRMVGRGLSGKMTARYLSTLIASIVNALRNTETICIGISSTASTLSFVHHINVITTKASKTPIFNFQCLTINISRTSRPSTAIASPTSLSRSTSNLRHFEVWAYSAVHCVLPLLSLLSPTSSSIAPMTEQFFCELTALLKLSLTSVVK